MQTYRFSCVNIFILETYMRRGEITGHFFDMTKEDVGMPFRSMTESKRAERKNRSVMDELVNDNMEQEVMNFEYFDPSTTPYAHDAGYQPTRYAEKDPRLALDVECTQTMRRPYVPMSFTDTANSRIDFDSEMRNPKIKPRMSNRNLTANEFDRNLQNISSYNSEYINNIALNIFQEIAKQTYINFCTFPLGILSTFIENDQNIKKIMSVVNTKEIFHEIRIHGAQNAIISRSSVILNLNSSVIARTFSHYEDNENHMVEIPMNNANFALGFICNKNGRDILLTQKLFTGYTMNLKKSNRNVYCPAFKITNRLNMTNILASMGYVRNNANYMQTIYLESPNNIFIKKSSVGDPIDMSDNFIFYIRYVPNNIILFLGRHGEL